MNISPVNNTMHLSIINYEGTSNLRRYNFPNNNGVDSFERNNSSLNKSSLDKNIIFMEVNNVKDINFGGTSPKNDLKYKRILLKVSGEALMGKNKFGIDPNVMKEVVKEIKKGYDAGAQIAIVVGGGNIFRGVQNSTKLGMSQASADYVGMLATVMNGFVLNSMLKKNGVPSRLVSAIDMHAIAEPYVRYRALKYLEDNNVVVFVAGTGNPFFTTDTAASLRAAEMNADAMFMAKNKVDGIYDKDPKIYPDAKKFDKLTYDDVIKNDLKIMDTSAVVLCKQNKVPLLVFDFNKKDAIANLLKGDKIGTYVGE